MSPLIEELAIRVLRLTRVLNRTKKNTQEEKEIIASIEDAVTKMKDALATRH